MCGASGRHGGWGLWNSRQSQGAPKCTFPQHRRVGRAPRAGPPRGHLGLGRGRAPVGRALSEVTPRDTGGAAGSRRTARGGGGDPPAQPPRSPTACSYRSGPPPWTRPPNGPVRGSDGDRRGTVASRPHVRLGSQQRRLDARGRALCSPPARSRSTGGEGWCPATRSTAPRCGCATDCCVVRAVCDRARAADGGGRGRAHRSVTSWKRRWQRAGARPPPQPEGVRVRGP